MNRSELLVRLPVSLGHYIVSNWLTAKSLSALDVSYCNHVLRSRYFELLQGCKVSALERIHHSNSYFCMVRWLLHRKVMCTSFALRTSLCNTTAAISLLEDFLFSIASSLETVSIRCDNTDLIVRFLELISCPRSVLRHIEIEVSSEGLNAIPFENNEKFNSCICETMHNVIDAAHFIGSTSVSDTFCSHCGLSSVGNHCHLLERFELWGGNESTFATDEGIAAIGLGCPLLKHLLIDNCCNLTDVGLRAIATHCTQLQELTIAYNPHITDAPLITLAHTAGIHLQSLCLDGCDKISGTALVAIAELCPSLHAIVADDVHSISAAYVAAMIPKMKNVKVLCLSRCALSNAVVALIADHLPQLEVLHMMMHMYEVTDFTPALMQIVSKCEKIRILELTVWYLDAVPDHIVDIWRRIRPALQVSYNFM